MSIKRTELKKRKGWAIDNGNLVMTMLEGGGHIASLVRKDGPKTNPYWSPTWKTIEPSAYKDSMAGRYACQLLAGISGHNLCLGWFGESSKDEAEAGLGPHGEAPVAKWKLLRKKETTRSVSATWQCTLKHTQMRLDRTVKSIKGSSIIDVSEKITNLARRDVPFTMSEHVTLGPPFLEKGVTVFDMPVKKAHTFPGHFGDRPRLKEDTAFTWPDGPGCDGRTVNMRMIAKRHRVSSDFSTQLVEPKREYGWFSALNPKAGLLLAYVWPRADFPWIANWEENYGRKGAPWNGKSLTRGMEFANTPFPVPLRDAVDMGKFQGQKTFRWLPARKSVVVSYRIVYLQVPNDVGGVLDIRPFGNGIEIDLITS